MLLVRPARLEDHAEILALAKEAGIGMTSLPPDSDVLRQKIERSVESFAVGEKRENDRRATDRDKRFLFVLEDTDTGKLVGTTGIAAHVGLTHPFYSYKLSTIVQASDAVHVYSQQRVLHMVNDYTGATEIGSLFLLPSYRRDGIGSFLSRCRFLMLAQFPDQFSDVVIAEIRGVQDENGHSPFYQNLAQHFFKMDFQKADFTNATQGGQFISDLMPKYPIYVNLLDKKAQAVIGQPFEASRPAVQLLKAEGFRNQGYIDVFDAGPTLQADRGQIRTVAQSRYVTLERIIPDEDVIGGTRNIVSSTRYGDFCMTYAPVQEIASGRAAITKQTADVLKVKTGDSIRYI